MEDFTRYGAAWHPLRTPVGVLRARASRLGSTLQADVGDVDALASAIGADLWMVALSADSLSNPARYGTPAVRALAAVLARSAGIPRVSADSIVVNQWATDEMLLRCEHYVAHIGRYDLSVAEVLGRVVADLWQGSADRRIQSAVAALLSVSSEA